MTCYVYIVKDFYPFAPNNTGPMAYYDKGYRAIQCTTKCGGDAGYIYRWSPKFETRKNAERFGFTQHILKMNGLM